MVLGNSLKKVKAEYPLYCLCSEDISTPIIETLKKNGISVIVRPRIDISNITGKEMSGWDFTFFKFSIFSLAEFDKLIYLDADMMVIRNIDHLFEKKFALCKDDYQFTRMKNQPCGCNSGLIVFSPDMNLYKALINTLPEAYRNGMRGDQEVLNMFLDDSTEWLSAKYNMSSNMVEESVVKEKYFDFRVRDVCVVHFAFVHSKPFLAYLLKPLVVLRKLCKLHFVELNYILQYYKLANTLADSTTFWKYVDR